MAKITRPILRRICLRHRLFEQMDHLRSLPVIWVSAPAGSGKTTLISSYIESRKIPCLWYELDRSDGDIATFFYYMGQAAAKAAPKRRTPLPLLTPEYLQGIPTFTTRYFEELYSRLKVPSLIVFDNYQEVPDESPLHEIIHMALSLIPEGMNAVVISRKDSPSAFIRLKANQHVDFLRWESIRLAEDEAGEIVTRRAKEISSPEMIHYLHGMSDGWAAGLVLISEAVKRDRMALQSFGKNTLEEVFVYFAREVFEKLDRKTQEFLLTTAFLPKMTVRMAEEITRDSFAGEILHYMNQNNFFITKHFDDEPVFEYHPLCRDFLQAHARKLLPSDTLSGLQRSAAGILERAGQTESAVSLLKDIGDWEGMTGIITSHAPDMIKQGRFHSVQQWLNSMPDEVVEGNPWLLYWKGMSILPFAPLSAKASFKQAFAGFQAGMDTLGALLAACAVVNSISYGNEDCTPLDHWYPVLNNLTHEIGKFPSEEIKALVIASIITAITVREISHREAETWEQQALELAETPETINSKCQALLFLFLHKASIDMREALYLLPVLQYLSRSGHAQPLTIIACRVIETIYFTFIGLHHESMRTIHEGLELSRKTGIHVHNHWFYLHAAMSFLHRMDRKGAQEWLEKMAPMVDHLPNWAKWLYHHELARAALLRGDLTQALYEGKFSFDFSNKFGRQIHSATSHLFLAQVLHKMRRREEARQHLEESRSYAVQKNSRVMMMGTLLCEAQFAFDGGDDERGRKLLRESLILFREGGYIVSYGDDPTLMVRMCEKALEAGIEVEFVQTIIRRRGLIPDKPPVHIENWPWAIKIYTLGSFLLMQGDKPVEFSRKAQQKPLAMLKVLIALGGRDIGEDRITDLLWPDAEGDMAHQSFETTLHRLRKLLAYPEAVSFRDGRVTLDERYCWVDVWSFERLLTHADGYKRQGKPDHAREYVEKAIKLYRGAFLAGDREEVWITSLSERLRSKYVNSVWWLGHTLEAAGRWDNAAEYYDRCLEVDECMEDVYRRLMICYKHLGRRSEALSVYQRCRKMLSAVLGINPSPETEAVRASILSGKTS